MMAKKFEECCYNPENWYYDSIKFTCEICKRLLSFTDANVKSLIIDNKRYREYLKKEKRPAFKITLVYEIVNEYARNNPEWREKIVKNWKHPYPPEALASVWWDFIPLNTLDGYFNNTMFYRFFPKLLEMYAELEPCLLPIDAEGWYVYMPDKNKKHRYDNYRVWAGEWENKVVGMSVGPVWWYVIEDPIQLWDYIRVIWKPIFYKSYPLNEKAIERNLKVIRLVKKYLIYAEEWVLAIKEGDINRARKLNWKAVELYEEYYKGNRDVLKLPREVLNPLTSSLKEADMICSYCEELLKRGIEYKQYINYEFGKNGWVEFFKYV